MIGEMSMRLKNIIPENVKEKYLVVQIERAKGVKITFTGGLGAQLFSTAIYFYFKTKGYNVIADLSYFDSKHRIAIPGINGEMSHWKWEMTCYGISKDNFEIGTNVFHNMPLLSDGVVKHKLGVNALKSSTIKNFLDIEKKRHIFRTIPEIRTFRRTIPLSSRQKRRLLECCITCN